MKRHFFKIALFVFAGAIINVAVALAIAFNLDGFTGRTSIARVGDRYWGISRKDNFGSLVVTSEIWSGFCTGCELKPVAQELFPSWFHAESLWLRTPLPSYEVTTLVASGFPTHACWGKQTSGPPFHLVGLGTAPAVSYLGIPVTSKEGVTLLPVRPLWPGFAINTIFYAAIMWFLFFAPGAIRKRVRRKRGQCAACGYSLRDITSDKCPECGATA
jgi:hypothetical protein